jgi:hypothetical protein
VPSKPVQYLKAPSPIVFTFAPIINSSILVQLQKTLFPIVATELEIVMLPDKLVLGVKGCIPEKASLLISVIRYILPSPTPGLSCITNSGMTKSLAM